MLHVHFDHCYGTLCQFGAGLRLIACVFECSFACLITVKEHYYPNTWGGPMPNCKHFWMFICMFDHCEGALLSQYLGRAYTPKYVSGWKHVCTLLFIHMQSFTCLLSGLVKTNHCGCICMNMPVGTQNFPYVCSAGQYRLIFAVKHPWTSPCGHSQV